MAERGAGLAGGVIDAVPHLYVVTPNLIDLDAASRAVSDLLAALGQDTSSADIADTPRRAAAAMADSPTPTPFTMTTFANDGEYDEMVIARDIPFHSLCAHDLLPFIDVAHVGYVPVASSVCRSSLAWSSTSHVAFKRKSASLRSSPRRCTKRSHHAAPASFSRPNTCACLCAACRREGRAP